VAHTCNPSYSGGRDQENRGSKPALGKEFVRLKVKALSSSPSTAKKERRKGGREREREKERKERKSTETELERLQLNKQAGEEAMCRTTS
jgi:hypothetical protein